MLTHRQFITAGNSTFTVQSIASGQHFTYKVTAPKVAKDAPAPTVRFVKAMVGPDNEQSFAFMGTIFADGTFRYSPKAKVAREEAIAKGFEWLWRNVDAIPADKANFLPSCNCCRCGRKLTNPVSVEMAIGPECAGKLGD